MSINALNDSDEDLLRQIRESMKKIRYGSIEIVVHNSKVVQIECREKIASIKSSSNQITGV